MMKSLLTTFIFLLALSTIAIADQKIPYELQGVGIDDKTGQSPNLNVPFTDDAGKTVMLKDYFNPNKPVILALVYFECPNLCTMVLNSALDSIKQMNLTAGKDFEFVAISFDPKDKDDVALARDKKAAYFAEYKKSKPSADDNGFHFLTGTPTSIASVTSDLGFHYKWDKQIQQFAHASAIFVLTPQGRLSRVLYGIMYPPKDLKFALIEAAQGKIGTLVDQIMLFCYHYDAGAQKYVMMAQKMMTIGGAMALAVLGIFMAVFWNKEIKHSRKLKKESTHA